MDALRMGGKMDMLSTCGWMNALSRGGLDGCAK